MKVEDTDLGGGFAALFTGSGAHGGGVGFHHCTLVETLREFGRRAECTDPEAERRAAGTLYASPGHGDGGQMCGRGSRRAHLEDSIDEEVMELYAKHPVDSVNSLLADRLASRCTECARAKNMGIDPTIELLCASAKRSLMNRIATLPFGDSCTRRRTLARLA